MRTSAILTVLAIAAPGLLLAQDSSRYECTYGDLVRRVEIYTEPGVTVPCEVHYFKDTEAPGESQVLWSAQAQEGYCESKTAEFVAKLEGWGWSCGAGAEPESEAMPEAEAMSEAAEAVEEAVQDDTDVLSPGDPED